MFCKVNSRLARFAKFVPFSGVDDEWSMLKITFLRETQNVTLKVDYIGEVCRETAL